MLRKLFAVIIGLSLFGGITAAKAGGNKGELVVRVNLNGFSTFDGNTVSLAGGGAFFVSGDICKERNLLDPDCTPIGTFLCWGWIIGDLLDPTSPAVVSQEFIFSDRGKIQVQGSEDSGPRAVVGGTGDFRNVRGQAIGFDLSQFIDFGEFVGTFKLIGARSSDDGN